MPLNIEYTSTDFDALKSELINYLKETNSFKDIDYVSSNINTLVQLYAYLGSLFGFYINSIANESFLPSAKRYKNLNRIARILNYNPRGNKAATVDAVGYLNPEYCFGKEGTFFQIPAYSKFPSTKATPDNVNFSFTNTNQIVYLVRAFGLSEVSQTDFAYDGMQLPVTKPKSYWAGTTSTSGVPTFNPEKIALLLSDTKPLSILNRLDQSNYKKFDVSVAPLYDGSDASPAGQPFIRDISTKGNSLRIKENVIYYVLFNYDQQTRTAYLSFMEDGVRLQERKDDIIMSVRLEKDDTLGTFYTLKQIQNNSKGRYYVGVLGVNNLDSVEFAYDKLENTKNGIKQIHLDINKNGQGSPLQVLVDGIVYTFQQGRISSQVFDNNSWDGNTPSYNLNLNIVSPDAPDFNYDATITVTSKDPGANEVTIGKLYTNYIDPTSGIKAIQTDPGQRFGNFQAVPLVTIDASEQKSGAVDVIEGVTKLFVSFETAFTQTTSGDPIDYIVELTPSQNIQVWYSDKNESGFSINIEPSTNFSGKINWLVTRYKPESIKNTPVVFDSPMPQIQSGVETDYSIFLSASDNVRVWYTDKTADGFKIATEKPFTGTVSYSTFVVSPDQSVKTEKDSSTQKKGRISLGGSIYTKDIKFDVSFDDNTYGLHTISNRNINVWYTNKTESGFTINVEEGLDGQIVIDWFADKSSLYQYQKHGMIDFSGQTTNGSIPGIRFTNLPETFQFKNLQQGDVKFSYINNNGVIDSSNNNMSLTFAVDRRSAKEMKVNVGLETISYAHIRVFVKNEIGDLEEWTDASSDIASVNIDVGQKVFFIRVNEYKKIEIRFGDGVTFGTDPFGKEIIIFGIDTVGKHGNIPPNSLSKSIIISQNILGDDNITLQFETQFIQLIGLKTDVFTETQSVFNPTDIYDSEGTVLTEAELSVKQPTSAIGGNFIETTEELRNNAGTANLRQDRIVSTDDYKSFCDQHFADYIIKTKILNYKDMKASGILKSFEMEKYWFNHIFIVALPKYGNTLDKIHRDYILTTLDKRYKAMATVQHELISANLVPIDIRIMYRLTKFGNPSSIDTQIKTGIRNWFNRDNHELGETLSASELQKIVLNISGVQSVDIAINRDDTNSLNRSDYINNVSAPSDNIEELKRKKVLEILGKDPSLLKIIDPLFSVSNQTTGKTSWIFNGDLTLNKYEFPDLGDIIIEVGT